MGRLKVCILAGPSAGVPTQPLPQLLLRRHTVLLHALMADLAALPDVELMPVTGMAALPDQALTAARFVQDGAAGYMAVPSHARTSWRHAGPRTPACILASDAVWPLALTARVTLERVSGDVLRAGRMLLGSAPEAVAATASKLGLARILAAHGIPVAATYSPHAAVPHVAGPWVAKPDDGAGCTHSQLFCDRAAALDWIRSRPADGYVLQPFVAGKPGSLSLICCDGNARVLACNLDRVAMRDNRFHVLGSVVNGLVDDDGALARLGQQVAAAIPGLWGHVGVDFVLTARGAVVLDVNPHPSIAYAGLHASIGCNPAGLVVDLLKEPKALPAPVPPGRRRAVSVDAGGT